MDLICQIIKQGKEETETFWDKAVQDSNEAGGNDIYTISMNESLELKGQKATGGEVWLWRVW